MHFTVHCLDTPDGLPTRLANYDAHKAHLVTAPVQILISGPLMADDDETMIGSFLLIAEKDRARVEALAATTRLTQPGSGLTCASTGF